MKNKNELDKANNMKKQIDKANKYIKENRLKVNPRYRHKYHLMGEVGWINDPNGFSIFNGEYQLFFQYHPYSSSWGPMHWGHAKSKDLITWESLPVALAPIGEDSDPEGGCAFSGCAVNKENFQYLLYTENWPKKQVQSAARSSDGLVYERLSNNPVIDTDDLPKNANPADFRDPKVWKKGEDYYLVVTSRTNDSSGQLLLYKSKDLLDWHFESILISHGEELGYIWECPDIFSLNNQDILLVSAQYLKSSGNNFNNVHTALYFTGNLDYEQGKFKYFNYREIDNGFDFYAPQTIIDHKKRRIMIAWMAMWEKNIPTKSLDHKWAGSITLPRVLDYKNGRLIQKPVEEIKNYRTNYENENQIVEGNVLTKLKGDVCELDLEIENIDALSFGLKFFQGKACETVLTYDSKSELLIFDRSNSGYLITSETKRETNVLVRKTDISLMKNRLKLQIFLDKSSAEIFIQEGIKTMTGLVYPNDDGYGISLFTNGGKAIFNINKWDLMR